MERHRIEVVLEADQPIKHLAESFGNMGVLMTRKIRQPDGDFARVPCLTGDAMRHGKREAYANIHTATIGADVNGGLSEAALRLLFAGGMVTGNGDAGSVKMGEYRKLVEMVPGLALLGGCAMNRTIPGRLDVDDATLVCAESARYLPAWARAIPEVAAAAAMSFRGSVEEVQRVRMDPLLDPAKRALLTEGDRTRLEARSEAYEKASVEGDASAKDATKSTMMPRSFQRVVQGSLFTWGVTARLLTPLDVDTFYAMFCAFAADMVVGGGRSNGHGRLRIAYDAAGRPMVHRTILRSAADVEGAVQESGIVLADMKVGSLLGAHLRDRRVEILEYLKGVNA